MNRWFAKVERIPDSSVRCVVPDATRKDMKTILVTGATGFLGRHLVDRFSEDGHRLRCIVRNPAKAAHLDRPGIELVFGDLSEQEKVEKAVEGVDAVVHAAGQLGGWGSRDSYFRNNVTTTRNLLEASERHGIKRFIFVSSVAVYGMQPNRRIAEETPPTRESNPYCRTKLECERLVRQFVDRHGLIATILRPSIIFGPHDGRFVQRVAEQVRTGTFLAVGRRNQGPPLVYVRDVMDFAAVVLSSQSTPFEVYNLSSPENVSWERIVEEFSAGLGVHSRFFRIPYRVAYAAGAVLEFLWKAARASRPPLLTRFLAALIGLPYHFDSSKAQSVTGFPGFTPFSTALDVSIRWVREETESSS